MKTILILFLGAFPLLGQVLTLQGPGVVRPGDTVLLQVGWTGGLTPAGFQWSLGGPFSSLTPNVGAAAKAASKTVACGPIVTGKAICLVYGLNQTTIADGQLAELSVVVPATAAIGPTTFALTGTFVASAAGGIIANLPSAPLSVIVTTKCDLNGDGATNNVDLLVIVNKILGVSPPAGGDLNADGKVDLYDAFVVIVAGTGGACTAQ